MMLEDALSALKTHIEPERIEAMTRYHKQSRVVLGVANGPLNDLTKLWRQDLPLAERVALADALWQSDIFEARIAAGKLLTQSRIKDDDAAWDLLQSWVADFDSWAIADQACSAIGKRLIATPARLDTVESWTGSDYIWTRRAALVATLPWAKLPNPKPADDDARTRILNWAAGYVSDRNWFIQKAVAWWLRDLSKHDAARVQEFLATYGAQMKPFAQKEAAKYLAASDQTSTS